MVKARVVIVGGGFAGLYAARQLVRAPVDITLLDRRNHHLFQPLLYQVATATLNPSDIAVPIRSVLRRQRNVRVLMGEAVGVDTAARQVRLGDGEVLPYDYLLVATGATHSYFGHDAWAAAAPGLKSIDDALEIRRRVFLAYEAAERLPDPEKRRPFMTFVIIGAGPTGVEMAGALAEIARHGLQNEFRAIQPSGSRIVLIEGQDRVLPTYPEALSAAAARRLQKLGVELHLGKRVTGVDEFGVAMGSERLEARSIVWAAGVAASPLARSLGVPLDRAGRVIVRPDLTIPDHDEVFVAGDLAYIQQEGGEPVPGVSPAAMQAGRHVAASIRKTLAGKPRTPFRYFDKGSFAVIGRGAAVGNLLNRFKMKGLLAWLSWLFIHLYFLIGFRNRLLVLIDWAYSYVFFRHGARLVTGEDNLEKVLGAAPAEPIRSSGGGVR